MNQIFCFADPKPKLLLTSHLRHEGAVISVFALGESNDLSQYAEEVIKSVPLEETLLVEQALLRHMIISGNQNECLSKGLLLLRKLGFDIPISVTPEKIQIAMGSTMAMVSKYDADQIVSLCDKAVEGSGHSEFQLLVSFIN